MLSFRALFRKTARLLFGSFLTFLFVYSLAAKDTWIEVRSPNFTVISNAGDKEARRVADQFEQFRDVFHLTFPQLRVDLGKPLVIFAVKNEDSLKILLPAYWETKGHAHPAGIYVPGEDRHFVAVRTDLGGDNPYEVVYHEYTHAIMNLNYRELPVWLGEGLAELFGNSVIRDKDVQIGKANPYHLMELQQNRLIPIDVLLMAGHDSPYYNEQNRVSVFYAESWAIVHYLMMDPEARKRGLINNFLKTWDANGDQVEAAQASFGDLKKFSQAMEAYSRQKAFYVMTLHSTVRGDPKSYSSRELPESELAAYRALFYARMNRPNESKSSVDEALQADPNLPLAHEAKGFLAFSQHDFPTAEQAFARAIELNSSSYFVYYFDAQTRLRENMPTPEERTKITALLEKSVSMNPQFAPAYAALASVYSMDEATRDKAFQDGMKSVQLEPGTLIYAISFVHVLLNCDRIADAKIMVDKIRKAAKTPQERDTAETLASAVENRESYDKQMKEFTERTKIESAARTNVTNAQTANTSGTEIVPVTGSADSSRTPPPKHANEPEYAVEGVIGSAECNSDSSGKVTLIVNHVGMKFLYTSLKELQLVGGEKGSEPTPGCSDWKGKKVRLYFYQAKNKPYAGELSAILFF
jgi:tetratricopeptide (TPR) repeat protein